MTRPCPTEPATSTPRLRASTSYRDSAGQARAHIAEYVVVNDMSERALQIERGGQWSKGKSAETFNPAGPWLVTPDELPDVMGLRMWLNGNGHRRQAGSTSTMVLDPFVIVHYLSQFLVLVLVLELGEQQRAVVAPR